MRCYDVPTPTVDGTKTLCHTRPLDRAPIVHSAPSIADTDIAATPYNVLTAGTRGPAIMRRARAVERGSGRWMHFAGLFVAFCLPHIRIRSIVIAHQGSKSAFLRFNRMPVIFVSASHWSLV